MAGQYAALDRHGAQRSAALIAAPARSRMVLGVPPRRAARLLKDLQQRFAVRREALATTAGSRHSARATREASQLGLALNLGPAGEPATLELQLLAGDPATLIQFTRQWLHRHHLWLMAVPDWQASPGDPGGAFARAVIAQDCLQLMPAAARVANAQFDGEDVHQLRVGLRRLRCALRELQGLSEDWPHGLHAALARTCRALGVYRDGQTVLCAFGPRLLAAGAAGVDWMHAGQVQADPVALTRNTEFQCALLDALAFARSVPAGPPVGRRALKHYLQARLDRLHGRLLAGAGPFESMTPQAQHAVRKRLKRLHDVCDVAAPLFEAQQARDYLTAITAAQRALGRRNDVFMACDVALRAGADDADAQFAAQWLEGVLIRSSRGAARQLRRAARATPFWRRTGS